MIDDGTSPGFTVDIAFALSYASVSSLVALGALWARCAGDNRATTSQGSSFPAGHLRCWTPLPAFQPSQRQAEGRKPFLHGGRVLLLCHFGAHQHLGLF